MVMGAGAPDTGIVVAGAASVEPAVLLRQRERIERPVLAFRLDHIEVRQEDHGRLRPRPTVANGEVLIARLRADDLDVAFGKTGFAKPASQQLGCLGGVARRMGCVSFDQLSVHFAAQLLMRRIGELTTAV